MAIPLDRFAERGGLRRISAYATGVWPLVAAIALYGVMVTALVIGDLAKNDGHFVYALDDTYIHLAIAKNLSRHHVWGINPSGFAGASSSPLWILLLAAWDQLGLPMERAPLALNVAASLGLLVLSHRALRRRGLAPLAELAALFGICVVTPLPALTLAGMEHLLQALLCVWLFDAFLRERERDAGRPWWTPVPGMLVLAPLAVATRYESLFLVTACAASFALGRRRAFASAIVAASAVPVLAYGVYAVLHGGTFLPTSVLLKSRLREPLSLFVMGRAVLGPLFALSRNHDVLTLLVGVAVLLSVPGALPRRARGPLVVFAATFVLHLVFARLGWFYRYEAYLFALGIFAVAAAFTERSSEAARPLPLHLRADPRARWGAAALALAALPFAARAAIPTGSVVAATHEIYQQQHQMARFVERFYPDTAVALNDIGEVSYRSGARVIDLWGLGSKTVLDARRSGAYGAAEIDAITRGEGVKLAIVYDAWWPELPRSWQKVAEWTLGGSSVGGLSDRVVAGSERISFYAVGPDEAAKLAAYLSAFAPELPRGVRVSAEPGCALAADDATSYSAGAQRSLRR